ncbi:hypothetical protein FACS189472_17520 [Alphaproteobacteria bacterium]|nr:hypothetical protein FACS189472_17520 [Alphaproteobacteria bacterium]
MGEKDDWFMEDKDYDDGEEEYANNFDLEDDDETEDTDDLEI